MKFLTDEMHGNLTTWLRLLGYDTKYSKDYEDKYGSPVNDNDLIKESIKNDRIMISNDKELIQKLAKRKEKNAQIQYIFLKSDDLIDNMSQLYKEFDINLDYNGDKALCSKCNSKLERVKNREKYKEELPELVYKNKDKIWKCVNEKCGKFYWIGGHFEHILNQLDQIKNSK